MLWLAVVVGVGVGVGVVGVAVVCTCVLWWVVCVVGGGVYRRVCVCAFACV